MIDNSPMFSLATSASFQRYLVPLLFWVMANADLVAYQIYGMKESMRSLSGCARLYESRFIFRVRPGKGEYWDCNWTDAASKEEKPGNSERKRIASLGADSSVEPAAAADLACLKRIVAMPQKPSPDCKEYEG